MMRRIIIGLMLFIMSFSVLTPLVNADTTNFTNVTCPTGMSQLDCSAIYGGWVDWVPDNGCSASAASTTLTGSDNTEKAYNFFINTGLSTVQAAAVVGNLKQESQLNPLMIEGGNTSQNPADAGAGGWGLAQWSPGAKIIDIAKGLNITTPITDFATQLNIIAQEMQGTSPTGYQNVQAGLLKINDLSQAVEFFRAKFEAGTPGRRLTYAQEILAQYGSSTPTAGSSTQSSTSGSNAPSCTTLSSVTCSNGATQPGDTQQSSVRQTVVCLAQAELALWKSGQMGPGKPGDQGFMKYTAGRNDEWCAYFVSWLYKQANYPITSGNGAVAAVISLELNAPKTGNFSYHPAQGYTPQPGDMVIFNSDHANTASHVNMVISVNSAAGSMDVIGGNQGNVKDNSQSLVSEYTIKGFTSSGITGYVSPTH